MKLPGFWLRHRVTVEPYEGSSANGPIYGAPVSVRCFLEESSELTRTSDGTERVSTARYFARLDTIEAPPQSRVTLPSGRVATVIDVARHDGGGLPTPDHLEVRLDPGRTA